MSTVTPFDCCPTCAHPFDRATCSRRRPDGSEPKPKPGDISMCMSCGEALVFGDDMRTHKAPTQLVAELDDTVREFFVDAQRLIRKRGPLPVRRAAGVA